jgi:hypothetical protein
MFIPTAVRTILTMLVGLGLVPLAGAQLGSSASDSPRAAGAPPTAYVADFVSTAATGIAMNDAGDVGARRHTLETLSTAQWRARLIRNMK